MGHHVTRKVGRGGGPAGPASMSMRAWKRHEPAATAAGRMPTIKISPREPHDSASGEAQSAQGAGGQRAALPHVRGGASRPSRQSHKLRSSGEAAPAATLAEKQRRRCRLRGRWSGPRSASLLLSAPGAWRRCRLRPRASLPSGMSPTLSASAPTDWLRSRARAQQQSRARASASSSRARASASCSTSQTAGPGVSRSSAQGARGDGGALGAWAQQTGRSASTRPVCFSGQPQAGGRFAALKRRRGSGPETGPCGAGSDEATRRRLLTRDAAWGTDGARQRAGWSRL